MLQFGCVMVVQFCMLENPFPDEKVAEMMKWRVNTGHTSGHFDENQGLSLVSRICQRQTWSYEQSQYDEIFGISVSALKESLKHVISC